MPGGDRTGPPETGFGRGRGTGRGLGRMQGPLAAGPLGNCKCPKCGFEQTHVRGQPCNLTKCPKCSSLMARVD
ncbi:MAG: hypothetical protein KAS30_03405 [Candidatus Diapherotrites archaeon]|nr:hypothetical protein [Candidatus Diapherotrites archaeon]